MPDFQQPSYYLINGTRYQHASLEMNFGIPGFGQPTLGLQSVTYDEELVPGELRGTSPVIIGVTTGKYNATGKMKLPKAEGEFLVQQLSNFAAANPDPATGIVLGWGQVVWSATLNYFDVGQPLMTDQWFQVRAKKSANDSKVSPDPLYTDFDLFMVALSQNGNFMVFPQTIGQVFLGSAA